MIKVHIEQGSEAWHQLRCGRITGTRFKALTMGESTQGYKDLITDLVGEILTNETEPTYTNAIMDRGTELEPEARKYYEHLLDVEVEQVGMCLREKEDPLHDWIGISPDGLTDGLLEIKCPLRKTHLNYIERGVMPNEYKWQVQGQLFVTGLPYCDFMSYYPDLKPFIIRIYPDEKMFNTITERLFSTILRVQEKLETYNKYEYDK